MFALALMFAVSPEQHAEAQLIQIGRGFGGGVRVRVPFVAVDVAPWGDTRVRAPFTSVNTGIYAGPRYSSRYRGPIYQNYAYPPASPYYRSVPSYPSSVYSAPNYRSTSPIVGGSSAYGTPQSTAPFESNPSLGGSSNSYGNSIIASATPSPALGNGPVSASSPGAGSREIGPAVAASDDSLRRAATQLQTSLSRRGGDSDIWIGYLAPAEIVRLIDSGQLSQEMAETRLRNFRGVTFNPELRWLTSVPGFAETRRQLELRVASTDVVNDARQPTPADTDPAAADKSSESTETLPLPKPDVNPNGANSGQPTPAKPVAEPDAKPSVGI
ncbi:hypothetical protein RMSM_07560 [Rhodopirellula maiorica SM1]|uniref:Uncharacterized protein n=2 Tax=Novipirellula TaxID=2795426 RepID=M5R8Z3_9BACT|nr:hypothetical protein RMSM_07560 [Rhodopirellula maiorica SM1]